MRKKRARSQNETLTAAAERYFGAWIKEGEAVLARHKRYGERLPARLNLPDLDDVRELRKDANAITNATWVRQLHLAQAFHWLDVERGHFGGPLGSALSEMQPCPIALEDELDQLLSETPEQLRARPPVAIVRTQGKTFAVVITPMHYDRIGAEQFAGTAAAVSFAAVIAGLEHSDPTSPQLRALFHTFAADLWEWHQENRPPHQTALALGAGAAIIGASVDDDASLFDCGWRMLLALAGSPVELFADSTFDQENWERRPGFPPRYGDENASVTVGGAPNAQLAMDQEERAWNTVLALDEDALITFIFVMSRWLAEGANEKVRISVNDLLALRNRKRHHCGDFRPEQKREQREQLLSLREQWVTVKDTIVVPHGKRQRKKTVYLTSPLIELAIESEEDAAGFVPLPLGGGMPDTLPYVFRIGLGDWSKPYLQAGRYMMPLMRTLAELDPNQGAEQKALRFAIKLGFRWNGLGQNGRFKQSWTIRDLLKEARIEEPTNNPSRFREQVEGALDVLCSRGVIGRWHEDPDNKPLPERGWLNGWLLSKITIEPPDDVRAFYAAAPAQLSRSEDRA
jgi:hypothetical protein